MEPQQVSRVVHLEKRAKGNEKMSTVPYQQASLDIWDKKYRLKSKDGTAIDETMRSTFERVAKALAALEPEPVREMWRVKFLWALENGAIPGGRIISNAGAHEHKPATSTINCTVSETIEDSMDGILHAAHQAGLTLKSGAGIGYEFSTLRPKGALVRGAGATTSGPLPFMDIFDAMCRTISSAGGRRGAQMGTFDVHHPDILDFIRAKRENGRLRHFNLSVLVTDDFLRAVEDDRPWDLSFNGKVYRTIPARRLWDVIMNSTYDYAEPGFILIDKVNEMNNNWFCEDIRATNPCGEQPLPPGGSCLLGSVNLTKFVENPFTPQAMFNWDRYEEVVAVFTRMLDNVVEINGLPLEIQRQEILRKRRHGMGFLGLGSAITMLGMRYGSEESVQFTSRVTKRLAVVGMLTGVKLAAEKGCAPIFNETVDTSVVYGKRWDLKGYFDIRAEQIPVKDLFLESRYIRHLMENGMSSQDSDTFRAMVREHGCRFTHHTSIAPTGTIALSLANNASNGIEPSFSHRYFRNVVVDGKKSKERMEVCSYELLAYRAMVNPNADPDATDQDNQLPAYFVDAAAVSPREHVDIQAAAQEWVDSSISKTINVPTDIPYEQFKDVYLYAWKRGLKGCTTFRYNPEAFQGVLVRDADLANTVYRFRLDGGEIVEVKGNEEIEYDGEVHSAANLYDALKEGYYGRF